MPVAGFKYFFDLLMGIGKGADELIEIKVGDKTAWRGSVTTNSQITIDQPNLFGGEKMEGGIQGTLDVMFGGPTQTAPAGLLSTFGSPQPGRRGKFTAFFSGLVCMNSPYPKPWKMRHSRTLADWDGTPWYPEKCRINLVRPASAAELGDGGGLVTEEVGLSQTFERQFMTNVITLPTNGTVLSVAAIDVHLWNDNGTIQLVAGVDYTVAGDQVTFLTDNPDCQYINVLYTAEVELNGSGIDGIGDTLIRAMNPVHVLYEVFTDRRWGRGFPREYLDDVAWKAAADTTFAEKHGYCRRWSRQDEIGVFAQSVIDHIGAAVYEDRVSGLLTIKLIRGDYIADELPLFDTDSGIVAITDAPVSSPSKMINEVQVKYRDPVTNDDRIVRTSNLAALQAAGGASNVLTTEYPGCPTSEIASKLAKRDMRSSAPGLRKFDITFDRRGSKLHPGSVIRIQDAIRNIPDQVVRIATIDYGNSTRGEVKATAVNDVFSTPRNGFNVIGPPSWTPPSTLPCVGKHRFFELSYRSIYRATAPADFAFIEPEAAYLGLSIDKGTSLNLTVDMAVRDGAVEVEDWPAGEDYYCGYTPPP